MPQTLDDTNLGDFTLLPADDPALDSAADLDGAFVDPEGDPEIDAEFTAPPKQPYGRSWQFDLAKGAFAKYGQRPAELHGKQSLRQWIDFTMNIMAGAHSIFPASYGMEDPYVLIGDSYSPGLEADFMKQVETALGIHDRIVSVGEFEFQHNEDESIVYYQFVVRTDDGEELLIQPQFEG